jgi:hypothetical protein
MSSEIGWAANQVEPIATDHSFAVSIKLTWLQLLTLLQVELVANHLAPMLLFKSAAGHTGRLYFL